MTETKTEDPLLVAYRQAREKAERLFSSAMAEADAIFDQWLEQQRANAMRGAALATATWQDRFAAIQVLGDASVRMRKPGDWYVSQTGVEIGDGRLLSSVGGDGRTPDEAIETHWRNLTTLPEGKFLSLRRDGQRLCAAWDGDGWKTWTVDPTVP